MNPPTPEELVKQLAEREVIFKEGIDKEHEALKDTHTKKEFTFSLTEKRRLAQQQTIALMVEQAINDIINLSVLPRLSIEPNNNVKILYDIPLGKFTVWIPKLSKAATLIEEPSPEEVLPDSTSPEEPKPVS